MSVLLVPMMALLVQQIFGESPTGTCRVSPGGTFNSTNFLLNRRPLEDASARCNDGSAAQIFFRPCCNGDTPGDFCNESKSTWFVAFGDGNQDGWCWDESSCAARAATSPNLTSSDGLPLIFDRSGDQVGTGIGAFSKFAEVNANFYKAYAVYVPYCSSDLFLGECADAQHDGESMVFCGRSIARAALRSLLPDMIRYGADEVVLSGGAGLMNLIPEMKETLAGVATKVVALCDGCVLLDDAPSIGNVVLATPAADPSTCSDAWACAPSMTLPAAIETWGARLDESCGSWRCLLAGPGGALELAAAAMPLMARHPLYDVLALASRGDPNGHNASLAEEVRSQVVAALSPAHVQLAPACGQPQSAFTRSACFREGHRSLGAGAGASGLLSKALYTMLRGSGEDSQIDGCQGQGCNPSCVTEDAVDVLTI